MIQIMTIHACTSRTSNEAFEGKHLPKILATTFFKKKSSFFSSFVCQIIGVVCTAILSLIIH